MLLCFKAEERVGTLGEAAFNFVEAEQTGDWDEEWNGIPDPSFRSGGILTPINKWFKFACTPEAIKVCKIVKIIPYLHIKKLRKKNM